MFSGDRKFPFQKKIQPFYLLLTLYKETEYGSDMDYDKMVLRPLDPLAEDFRKGIKIYEERFEDSMRLSSEAIVRALQKTDGDIQLYSYGFYYQEQIIGFCLLTLYKKEDFVYVSYIALSSEISDYNTGRLFMENIAEVSKQLTDSFLLFEVEQGDILERLYRLWGIGMLHYHHVMPVFDMTLERVLARVMIYPKIKSIDKEQYLKCLSAFLNYEYSEGISATLSSEDAIKYREYIAKIYEDIKKSLPDTINVK